MNWAIERDEKGIPLRMWWVTESKQEKELQAKLAAAEYNNSLPMPSMREWARARKLIL